MKKLIPILTLIAAIINAAASTLFIARLPEDNYPVHFDIAGQPDRYGSKWNYAFIGFIALLLAIAYIIYRICTRDNENVQKNRRYEDVFIPCVIVLLGALPWIFLRGITAEDPATAFTGRSGTTVLAFVIIALGVLMLFVSNIMAKLKPNRNFGLRVRATLKDETVWRRTHRLCGYTGCIASLCLIVCGILALCLPSLAVIFFAVGIGSIIILGFVVPTIYAEVLYKKLH